MDLLLYLRNVRLVWFGMGIATVIDVAFLCKGWATLPKKKKKKKRIMDLNVVPSQDISSSHGNKVPSTYRKVGVGTCQATAG